MSGPYAFINDKHQHYSTIKLSLHLSPDAAFKFDTVNIHLRDQWVTPGQIVIIPDTHSISCTAQEARMMEAARVVSRAFGHSGEDVGTLVVQNYDLLQSLLGYSGLLIDSAGGSWARHLDGVINTLNEINRDHKLYLRRGTPIARVEFLNRRQVLFQTLDTQLAGMARYGAGLRNRGSIKKMLGISTRSYMHNGTIKGYAQKINGMSRTAKFLKNGTYVGWGLTTTASAIEVQQACSRGRADVCTRAKYVEATKLAGNIALGSYGSALGVTAGTWTCAVVLGAPTV
ncbi:hypothetical protein ACI2KS_15195 [Pseudomonas sp. NPDC087358]|uniref:hypothetical protein n=1 Tax=Pseudomonas sp. NPDC087358 TaxID=3364439 RepID=UPI00384B3152